MFLCLNNNKSPEWLTSRNDPVISVMVWGFGFRADKHQPDFWPQWLPKLVWVSLQVLPSMVFSPRPGKGFVRLTSGEAMLFSPGRVLHHQVAENQNWQLPRLFFFIGFIGFGTSQPPQTSFFFGVSPIEPHPSAETLPSSASCSIHWRLLPYKTPPKMVMEAPKTWTWFKAWLFRGFVTFQYTNRGAELRSETIRYSFRSQLSIKFIQIQYNRSSTTSEQLHNFGELPWSACQRLRFQWSETCWRWSWPRNWWPWNGSMKPPSPSGLPAYEYYIYIYICHTTCIIELFMICHHDEFPYNFITLCNYNCLIINKERVETVQVKRYHD